MTTLDDALARVAHLGHGGSGPWKDGSGLARAHRAAGTIHYPVVLAWLNATYAVQLLRHPAFPGIDHLIIRRHDNGVAIPWSDLQAIKDDRVADGRWRWAVEAYPPQEAIVDNHNLRHLWVMPRGWVAPVDLREVPC